MERARAQALSKQLMLDFMQMSAFAEEPLVIERAEGVRVWDAEGKAYVDGLSGIFVVNLGHGVREIVEAMAEQLGKVAFVPQMATSPAELELAGLILSLVPERYSQVKFQSVRTVAIPAPCHSERSEESALRRDGPCGSFGR